MYSVEHFNLNGPAAARTPPVPSPARSLLLLLLLLLLLGGCCCAAAMAVAAMLEEIDRFCTDEKQLVTYQWLSRKLNVPSDTSKR